MPARSAIYLDLNAGAPLHPEVRRALSPFFREDREPVSLTNPSSRHAYGREAARALHEARAGVARSLGDGVSAEQLIFTSSGTEANQAAIRAALEPRLVARRAVHWITSDGEHDCVRQMEGWLEARGGRVSRVPLTSAGAPDLSRLPELIGPETALVSLIWVNNETGVITDVEAAIDACRARGVSVHLDSAQAWGKLPLGLDRLGVDFAAFSGLKIGALPGTGVLYARRPPAAEARVFPGKQERERRGGTENLYGIVSLGAAAGALDPAAYAERVAKRRDRLESAVRARLPGFTINGAEARRVANTTSLSWLGAGAEPADFVAALDLQGFAVSAGSACASGSPEPSHVLTAMGRTRAQALASIRVSIGPGTAADEVDAFVAALERVTARLRAVTGGEANST